MLVGVESEATMRKPPGLLHSPYVFIVLSKIYFGLGAKSDTMLYCQSGPEEEGEVWNKSV